MPEQTSAGSGSFLQYLAGNLRRNGRSPVRVYTGFVIAWALFFLFWTVLPPFPGLTHNGMAVLGIVLWASVMWVSEAMPTGITGISIPTLLLITQAIPWQGGKPPMSIIFAGFTNHVIWLCLFAFLVGAVMQLVGLDKRIALGILARLKASSVGRVIWGMFFVNIVLGFLVLVFLVSLLFRWRIRRVQRSCWAASRSRSVAVSSTSVPQAVPAMSATKSAAAAVSNWAV